MTRLIRDSRPPRLRRIATWLGELFAEAEPERVLFRVDAGAEPGLSFGHLSRCLRLAGALRREGTHCLFLMRDLPEGVSQARAAGFSVQTLPPQRTGEAQPLLEALAAWPADWLVHDLPYEDAPLLREADAVFRACRAQGRHSVFLDDARFATPAADVICNASILAPERTKISPQSPSRFLLGPRYFIFDHAPVSRPTPPAQSRERRILLTFGGSDLTGLTVRALTALATTAWPGVRLTALLGPGCRDADAVAALAGACVLPCRVLHNVPDAIALLRQSDFVVCAGGITMYELLSLQKPFLPVASASHEGAAVDALRKRGWITAGFETWPGNEVFRDALRQGLAALEGCCACPE